MSFITATNYNGRLHLGYGDENSVGKCLGNSIYTYCNSISKFFTKLFGFSIELDIDGKQRCVNKKSLIKHLESIGLENISIEKIRKIGYNTLLKQHSGQIITRNDNLGESFSIEKRMKLFEKMVTQLEVNNTQAVKRLIRKGAYVDREFFKPADGPLSGQSFWSSRPMLEEVLHRYYINTNFYSYTPLALATEKGNQSLAKFILGAKNGDVSSDRKQTIHQSLTSNNRTPYWKTETIKVEKVSVTQEGVVNIA